LRLIFDKTVIIFNIEECSSVEISTDREEFYRGEIVVPKYTIYGTSGKEFTVPTDLLQFKSSNSRVFSVNKKNLSLEAVSKGFSDISLVFEKQQSNSIKLSSIIPVTTDSPISGEANSPIKLNTHEGPQKFTEDQKQNIQVTCPKLSQDEYSYSVETDEITFKGQINTNCQISIQNEPIDINPHPIVDTTSFDVSSTAIGALEVEIYDPSASELEECQVIEGFIPRKPIKVENNSVYRLPLGYKLHYHIYAVDVNKDRIGSFNKPGLLIDAGEYADHSDMTFKIKGPERATLSISAKLDTSINGQKEEKVLDPIIFYVDPIYPHEIDPNEIHLFQYSKGSNFAQIFNGTGHFDIVNQNKYNNQSEYLFVEDGYPKLSVSPNGERERTITVQDICIPENKKDVKVTTIIPDRIIIEGDHDALINTTVRLTAHLTSQGKPIEDSFFKLMDLSILPDDGSVTPVEGTHNQFDCYLTKLGTYKFTINAYDLTATHPIEVIDRFKFLKDNMTIWQGDTQPLPISKGENFGKIVIESENDEIAKIVQTFNVFGVNEGSTDIIAKSERFNYTARMTIFVIKVTGVEIVGPNQTWVDARIPYHAVVLTSQGPMEQLADQVSWTVDGDVDHYIKFDNTLVVHFLEYGPARIGASIKGIQNITSIFVDHRLEWVTPDPITLPLGSTYQLQVKHDLEVEYECMNGLQITEGLILANQEGYFDVRARYGKQAIDVMVIVSIPSKVLLDQEGPLSFRPRLIDQDDHEYTAKNNVTITFNSTLEARQEGDIYYFDNASSLVEPEIIECAISNDVITLWNVSDVNILFGKNSFSPVDPIVQNGLKQLFQCASETKNWKSSTPRVATIVNGLAQTHHKGKTIIECTHGQSTTMEVVDILGISLKPEDQEAGSETSVESENTFQIIPKLSNPRLDTSLIRMAPDMHYKCEWDATECGTVSHLVKNGIHYCVTRRLDQYFCPTSSEVRATMSSAMLNFSVSSSTTVTYLSNILKSKDSFMNMTLSKAEADKGVNIGYIPKPCEHVAYTITPNKGVSYICNNDGVDLKFTDETLQEAQIDLLLTNTGERARILMRRGNNSISNNYLNKNNELASSWTSLLFIIIILSVIVIAYKLGPFEMLPFKSPYNNK